jgi:hypothetical protein
LPCAVKWARYERDPFKMLAAVLAAALLVVIVLEVLA